MRDVSKRAFEAVLHAAGQVGVEEQTLHRLQAEVGTLGSWGTWDRWVSYLDSVESDPRVRELGGLRTLGERFPDLGPLSYLTKILQFVASPSLIYLAAGRWSGQSLFPDVKCETIELDDGRLRQTLTLPSTWRDSTAFFELMWGALISAPRLMSLSDSMVAMERSDRCAVFRIVPPPSMSFLGRWSRAYRIVRSGVDHDAIRLFSHMVEGLQDAQHDVRLLWERSEARNDELRCALAENGRVTLALEKARDELATALLQVEDEQDPLIADVRALSSDPGHRAALAGMVDYLKSVAGPLP